MSVFTTSIHTIICVSISETYLELYFYYYYNCLSIYTKVYVQLYKYLQLYKFQMNLNLIRAKIETEDLLPSKTKNCEKLIEQTHRKLE